MEKLKGMPAAKKIREKVRNGTDQMGKKPLLTIIRVGERPDDLSYERGARKCMETCGIEVKTEVFPVSIENGQFQAEFDRLNADLETDGILLFRPLPSHLDEKAVVNRINPSKDVDGICRENLAGVFMGNREGFAPCTAQAVIEILKHYQVPFAGKRVVVVGRSLVIGRPAALLFLQENATVTMCHSKTEGLKEICRQADILVTAIGKEKYFDVSWVKEGAAVVDVGIHVLPNGTICGDFNPEGSDEKCGFLTPVPGGVGSVTTAVLAEHVWRAALSHGKR